MQFSVRKPTCTRDLMAMFDQCPRSHKKGIWIQIGKQLGLTAVQAHDYFYNTWQLQFFDSPEFGKEELREIYLQCHDPNVSVTMNIKAAAEAFKKVHFDKRFCDRKLFQMLYHFANQCAKKFQKEQLSIYDNYLFQMIVKLDED